MSLLGSQVYANPNTPLWGSGGGGGGSNASFSNVTVTSNVVVGGAVEVPFLNLTDLSGNAGVGSLQSLAVSDGDPNDGFILQGELLRFGKQGTKNANTTFVSSVFGANADNFSVGGTMNCLIGPVPAQAITSSKTVNPVPTVAPAGQYGVDNTITGISGAEYDIQAIATVFVVSGVPAADDRVNVTVTIGAGQGSMSSILFPGATGVLGGFGVSGVGPLTAGGAAATCYMRARLTPNASGTTLGGSVLATLGGGSTAVYGSTLTILDVQRVR